MPTKIQLRRGTAAQWASSNPLLASGEVGIETDTKQFKVGDGSTYWNSLQYASVNESTAQGLVDAHANLTNNPHAVTKSQVGLSNVDNTSDANKPISSATQAALDLKYDASNPANYVDASGAAAASPVQSVAGRTGSVTLTKSDVGLSNVPNVDATERANHTGTQLASTISDFSNSVDARISLQKGDALGLATLDSGGKVPASQLPSTIMEFKGTWDASTNIPTLANGSGSNLPEDAGHVYVCSVGGTVDFGAGSLTFAAGDWVILSASLIWEKSVNSNSVVSVNGHQGVVVLDKSDVGLGNVDNTADANKPISTATQAALNLKYDSSNPSNYVDASGAASAAPVQSVAGKTGAVTLSKSDVGLGNVDNTSDANKPVSTATQAALNLKYDVSNPSSYVNASGAAAAAPVQSVAGRTGAVVLTKSDVGLNSVDNVSAASLRDRSTHTGTQLASTISDFTAAVQSVTIDASKIDGGTVSNAEFATLDGVNTAVTIQSQLDGKQATLTGATTTVTSSNLTASRAVVSDSSGKIAASATTSTEVGYLSGVTSGIQTQLNGKQDTITGAASSITSLDLSLSKAVVSDASGKIATSSTTATEVGYLSGVSSSVQTQLNGKEPTITAGTASQYYRGDKTFQTLDKTAVGLSNVDNVSAASLRDRTTHTGNESTLSWTEASDPSAPASGLSIFAKNAGGRQLLGQISKGGKAIPFQPNLGAVQYQFWSPNANANSSLTIGQVAPSATGTPTARTIATTNNFTWQRRIGYVSAATAGSTAGLRSTILQFGTGNVAGAGGFYFQTRFGISDAALVAGARSAVGLTATTVAFTNADPSTFLNFIGMAHDAADTNWQIMRNTGSGTATKIDLGANFSRSPAVSTVMYDLTLYCAPNGTTVYYEVKNLSNNAVASGSFNTNLPANTQLLTWQHWRSNNATAAAVGIDIASVYIETDL